MNLIMSAGNWFATNWPILVIIVLAIAFLVPTYLKQKKEASARNELNNTIKKGTKIVTTAGVYGVVDSIEDTTDGKVVTITTGNSKNPSTMTIHINAIMGIDNKTAVVEESSKSSKKGEVVEDVEEDVNTNEVEEKVQPKKKTTSSKKKD